MNLLLAGGSTGGHLVPGVAVARAWAARGGRSLFLTAGRPVEDAVLRGEPFGRVSLGLEESGRARSNLRVAAAFARAARAVADFRPDVVLGLGGASSVPGVLAARARGVPVLLLEVNATPGRATRWLRPFARRVLVGCETCARSLGARAKATGVPVRSVRTEIPAGPARLSFGLDAERPTLLVSGGSQGAERLNRFVGEHARLLERAGVQALHLAGAGKTALPEMAYRDGGARARVLGFLPDVGRAYAAASLVLCRGGAATLAEVAAAGRPAVVVPYPHHADRHQFGNAARLGCGAWVVEDAALDRASMERIVALLGDASSLAAMAAAAAAAARPAATDEVVADLASLCPPRLSTPMRPAAETLA